MLTKLISKCQRKKLDSPIKLKLYASKSVKYLGIRTDKSLNWEQRIHDITIKLNRANALLFTIRSYVDSHILIFVFCLNILHNLFVNFLVLLAIFYLF